MADVSTRKSPKNLFETKYIEERDGAYWIVGARVSLDSVVYAYREGRAPEEIVRSFPTLTLEYAYAAIAFYLARQTEIDRYLDRRKAEYEAQRKAARRANPALHSKLARARRQITSRS